MKTKLIGPIAFAVIFAVASINLADDSKPTSLFDGKSLEGWELIDPTHAHFWKITDGAIAADNDEKKIPTNTFLASSKEYEDFEFTCEFRLTGDPKTGLINSGIQYRSPIHETKKKGHLHIQGYQADIGDGWWGGLYDEHRRGKLGTGNITELLKDFDSQGWHTYKIVCRGNDHQLFIDGHCTLEYTEKDQAIPRRGYLALQLHGGGIAKIEYRNIQIIDFSKKP